MNKKLVSGLIAILLLSLQPLMAEIKIISPVPGKWSNKQILLIDNSETENDEYFYSVDGSSPREFGFAYDGPVLLDTLDDKSDIVLKVARISENEVEEVEVCYTVVEDSAYQKQYEDFIDLFFDNCILSSVAGSVLAIPPQLQYCFNDNESSYIQGRNLSVSADCVINRFIPCTVWDKVTDKKWHFLIQTVPQALGVYSKRELPFRIENWETVIFENQNNIYKIDSEFWSLPDEPVQLDRSVSHMISWQSIAFESGNPVEYFYLPPKPELVTQKSEDGVVSIFLKGDDSYRFSISNNIESENTQLFDRIKLDTFFGDKIEGKLKIGVYSNSVYQGDFEQYYSIDKCPPPAPVIVSNANNFYSRKAVKLTVTCPKDCELFVRTSQPYKIENMETVYSEGDVEFTNVAMGDFEKKTNSYEILFAPKGENVEYYKLEAYCFNGRNKSNISEQSVIIDLYNYYFDSNSDSEQSDGTIQNPYKNFAQAIDSIKKSRSVKLKVKGKLYFPEIRTEISSNCSIENLGDAELVFPKKGSLVVKSSSLEINGCRIRNENERSSNEIIPLIKIENGVLTLNDCQISAEYNKNGTIIDAYASVVNLNNIMAAVSCNSYASFISSVNSRINLSNSVITVNGATSVVLSVNGGVISTSKNSMKVCGQKGRIAELFNAEGIFMNNKLYGEFEAVSVNTLPLFYDKKSKITQKNNISAGF